MTTNCFLCGASAELHAGDFGNCLLYSCFSPDCGDYEISSTAMRWVVSPAMRLQASKAAFLAREKGGYLDITFSVSDCEFGCKYISLGTDTAVEGDD